MDATEKQILRAQLVASGIIGYWQWDKSKRELERWIEIMAEELGGLKDSDTVLRIRENLLTYGLRVPEISPLVHVDTPVGSQIPALIGDTDDGQVCNRLPKADSIGSTVHQPDVTALQAPQNSDSSRKSAAIESKEVTEVQDLAAHEDGETRPLWP